MVYYCSCRRKQVFGFYIIDLRRSLVIIVVEASSVQSAKLDFQNNMKRIRKLLKTETSIDLKVSKSRSRRFSLDPSLATKSATVAPINLPPPPSSKSPVKRKTEIFLGLKPNMIFFFFLLYREMQL